MRHSDHHMETCRQLAASPTAIPGAERRTALVILLTALMMIGEVVAGIAFGSMALLADGIHMGTHAFALGLTLIALVVVRRNHTNADFSFGSSRVGVLAGYTSALFLLAAALVMAEEAASRLWNPVPIDFGDALLVAGLGLAINALCLWIMGLRHDHDGERHADHNLRAAFLHIAADAVTSVAAITALLVGKFWNAVWLDPVVALLGALLIIRWGAKLLVESGSILAGYSPNRGERDALREFLSSRGCSIVDLHVWPIDDHRRGAILSLLAAEAISCETLRREIQARFRFAHLTVELGCTRERPDD
jgi:cation diffusion facilitator family transporter